MEEQIVISGYIKKVIYRDLKTGYSTFLLTTEDERFAKRHIGERSTDVTCSGIIPILPNKTPLVVTGHYRFENKPLFFAEKCEQRSSNDAFVIEFLKQKYFSGIGPKTINKILKIVNGDVFSFCCQDNASEILIESGIGKQTALLFVSKIAELKNMESLLHYLVRYGGDFMSAKAIYDKYEDKSIEVIEENPYLLSFTGLSYEAREAIAKEKGVRTHDDNRLKALLEECLRLSESKGNTCIPLSLLLKTAKLVENRSNMGYDTNPILLLSCILESKAEYAVREGDDEIFVYKKRTYELEERAARHIIRLVQSKKTFPIQKSNIESIEKNSSITYGEEQKMAFNLFESSGIKILTGGPGTGKSTVIDGLLQYYYQMFPENKVALCAPTGSAAKKLRDVTGMDAKTVHKLLNVRPFGKEEIQFKDEYDQLEYDLIIVDESSMIDIELFMMLMSGVKSGALLLFVGDEDQLSSVGPGNVLHDMIDSGYIETCQLKQVYRQSGDSSIVENSIRMRSGRTDLIQDDSFEILSVANQLELESVALDVIKKVNKGKRSNNIKVYSPVRNSRYITSTFNMNKKLHELFGQKDEAFLVFDGTTFTVGDPIVMTSNNYKVGYINGDEGVVTNIISDEVGSETMLVEMSDGTEYELSGRNLADVELAYAITVHKSQGAECDIAILLLPKTPQNMLERSLIYVGATRAKQKNIIITEEDALYQGILNSKKASRFSGLNAQVKSIIS